MDVFDVHRKLIADYREFTTAYVDVHDRRIRQHVEAELASGKQWPEPWLSLNPMFASGGSVSELVRAGLLHQECERIFRAKRSIDDPGAQAITLHRHQREAVEVASSGKSYVLTTGTGSGKSLAYIVPIVDRVLRQPKSRGIKAIIVYPMNALANSQLGELEKFLSFGYGEGNEPVSFARYTGQESMEERDRILAHPPDILLTNYIMLELVLTRPDERRRLVQAAQGLQFLVLDELHTYRGRQGSDVAFLVRRVRDACASPDLQCIGTSATMASGGSLANQRSVVAQVATRLFGAEVTAERVIGETLTRATTGDSRDTAGLARAVRSAPSFSSYDDMAASPLASWIEETFGLGEEPQTGMIVRRRPTRLREDAAPLLADATGAALEDCAAVIRDVLLAGSRTTHPATGRPLFAFRLHQFLSKGDTVYVSIEPETDRYITSNYQVSAPGRPGDMLFPLAFCRECGQEYLVVARKDTDGSTSFSPRLDRDASGGDTANGYLFLSADMPWPADPVTENRLPDGWVEHGDVVPSRRKYLPEPVWVGTGGSVVDPGHGTYAAFVPSPFSFCLRCQVSYASRRGSDFGKLATLDAEGRSSAISVISASVMRALRQVPEAELDASARKLLTFVDNRQDASLQAGHFNDFVQVAQLRGAVARAVRHSPDGLSHDTAAEQVVQNLGVDFADYAANPAAVYGARTAVERAFRNVVELRLYVDLQRGWRITMPNLEQTGLLEVGYESLPEIAADPALWAGAYDPLRDADPAHRRELCRTILDEFRRVLAVDVECLSEEGFDRLRRQSEQNLVGPWSLARNEPAPVAGVAFARPGKAGGARSELAMSGRSAVGRYLRRELGGRATLSTDDGQRIIADLLRILHDAGLLSIVVPPENDGPGYRLKASAIRWMASDGTSGAPDPLRKMVYNESGPRVNEFFKTLYQDLSSQLTGLHAAEHTAQIPAFEREQREHAFREGTLPLLYCSPTMELGVDIKSLNTVGLRNVPPTPANYAQRSGRAGRSGQPALVVTYCSTGNAHDQYYFRRSADMVAGSVAAPRLDLTNESLLGAHLRAIYLAETGLSLQSSVIQLVDSAGDHPTLELLPEVVTALNEPSALRRATQRARAVVEPLLPELQQAAWWHDTWVEDMIRAAPAQFDSACDRWRGLYRGALADQEEQNRLVLDVNVVGSGRRAAESRRKQAENQLRLLRNEDSETGHSDFYSYRYFASEGYLPGYSFPRLPLAAYIPAIRAGTSRYDGGDYLQRPRFLAISEFGPGALIYHEGARYEVTRIQVPMAEEGLGTVNTQEARRCESCGYHHDRAPGLDLCQNCGAALGAATSGLMHLQTVFTRRRERISSDEEERRRAGYELQTSFRFSDHGARMGRLDAEVRTHQGGTLAELQYGDTAIVRVTNLGRRRRKDPADRGYWLDTVKGRWLSEKAAADLAPEDESLPDAAKAPAKQKVIPYVQDTRNVLVLRLTASISETIATSLRYALERGIEAAFQLEDAELSSQPLPDTADRGRMLFTESSEGGAGVLRRMQAERDALAVAARTALEIAHFDPETGADLGHAEGATERCELACYDCLLSYSNQLDHALIDRHAVRDLLLELSRASTVPAGSAGDRQAQVEALKAQCTNAEECRFIELLAAGDFRLPDEAQSVVPGLFVRTDFVAHTSHGDVAIFIDGPHHDAASARERDSANDERLEDAGWTVLRFRYDEDWERKIRERSDVFGKGRKATS